MNAQVNEAYANEALINAESCADAAMENGTPWLPVFTHEFAAKGYKFAADGVTIEHTPEFQAQLDGKEAGQC